MSADGALRAIIADDATVAAIVGAAVYVATAPQVTTPPYVIAVRPDPAMIARHLRGRSGLEREEWQIECWADDRVKSDALGAAVRAALENAGDLITRNRGRALFGTTELRSVRHLGRAHGYDETTRKHVDRQAVVIWAVEP